MMHTQDEKHLFSSEDYCFFIEKKKIIRKVLIFMEIKNNKKAIDKISLTN